MSVILTKLFNVDVISTVIIFVSCAIITLLWRRRRLYYLASKIPGLNGLPLIGNVMDFGDLTKCVPRARKLMDDYGPLVKCWIGPFLSVALADPVHLQIVLNHPNCLRKCSRVYDLSKDFIQNSIVQEEPEIWKVHRKMLNPAFNQKILDSYVSIFREEGEILVERLKDKVGKGPFDFYAYVDKCTMDIVCQTTMCSKVDAQTKPTPFFDALSKILHIIMERIFRIWLHVDFIWERSWRGKEMKRNVKKTHYFTNLILEQSKDAQEKKEAKGEKYNDDERNKRAFLNILLDAEQKHLMDRTQIIHQISSMIFAGYDTSSITVSYMMLVAAFYPKVLVNIQQELDEVFQGSDRPIEVEDLPKLEYLERVIKEVLRVYTPVPFTARRNDTEIDLGDGKIIPENTTIWIPHILAHYNRQQWPDPDRFDPDRFLPEECAKRHPYAYIPFSAGPRNCIGFKYGMMMLKVLGAMLFRKYVPKTEMDKRNLVYTVDVVLKLKDGWIVTLEDRK